MVLLGHADPLPERPRRVLVAGTSGAGKTSLAGRIALALQAPHIEIDGLFHGPRWTPRPSFEADVDRFVAEPTWVTEWQYSQVRARLADRADLMVWLDLPKRQVLRQIVRRTVVRRLRRERLWNDNLEPPLRTFFTDPEHIVRWAWNTHEITRQHVRSVLETQPSLTVVRLRSHEESDRWLREVLLRSPPR